MVSRRWCVGVVVGSWVEPNGRQDRFETKFSLAHRICKTHVHTCMYVDVYVYVYVHVHVQVYVYVYVYVYAYVCVYVCT